MTSPRPFKTTAAILASLAAVVALPSLLAGCDNGCEQNRDNYLRVEFISTSGRQLRDLGIYYYKDDVLKGQTLQMKKFEDIEINLPPQDSLTRLLLECTYLDYGDTFISTDTVDITYQSTARFLDMNCGCTIDFDLDDVTTTHNLLGKVNVKSREVRTDGGINITFEY